MDRNIPDQKSCKRPCWGCHCYRYRRYTVITTASDDFYASDFTQCSGRSGKGSESRFKVTQGSSINYLLVLKITVAAMSLLQWLEHHSTMKQLPEDTDVNLQKTLPRRVNRQDSQRSLISKCNFQDPLPPLKRNLHKQL